jgi:phosphoketolase
MIDSMFNQHAKWLEKCNELPWRANVSSLNLLITALVWRQDDNGFTHQDPGFLDVVANKSPSLPGHRSRRSRSTPQQQIAAKSHAHEFGVDPQDITNWQWPF